MTGGDRVPSKAEGLMERALGEDTVVLSAKGDVLHTFGGSARFIWGLIDGIRSLDAMRSAIVQEYDIDESTAGIDLEAFVSELQGLSLIHLRQ